MRASAQLVLSTLALGCGGNDSLDIAPGPRSGACELSNLLGTFEVSLDDEFTSVQGKVDDSPSPLRISQTIETSGDCRLMAPPDIFCAAECGLEEICGAGGECVPEPLGMSVGTVTIAGLSAPVEMTASAPVFFYSHRGDLPHPGVLESEEVVLNASGDGAIEAFALAGVGIAPLTSDLELVELAEGTPVNVTWDAPGDSEAASVHIELNIAQHGGTPGWIECDVADTGSASIPSELSDALVQRGFSGFPSLTVERHSLDSEDFANGCIEFAIRSRHTVEVTLPGLTSCSDSGDCAQGESCQPDLTCG